MVELLLQFVVTMSSPASHYRRRNTLSNQYNQKKKTLQLKPSAKDSSAKENNKQSLTNYNDSNDLNVTTRTTNYDDINNSQATTNDSHTTTNDSHITTNALNGFNRRSSPTLRDIAASAMIFKIRRLQNNKNIDVICKFINTLGMQHIPKSMKAIQKQLRQDFDIKNSCKCYYICSNCGTSYVNNIVTCQLCNDKSFIFKFYLSSIRKQIQQLLLIFGHFTKLKEEKLKNIHLFSNTKYGEILQEVQDNAFTMIINFDGVSTCNKNLSLWPFIIIFNELPIPERRYLENIIVAGIVPTAKKPSNVVVQTCLQLIYEQLIQLEMGQEFYIKDFDERKILYFYLIASCSDKPAESLIENVVLYNAEYGCPKCFTPGESFHGQRGSGANQVSFTIRVYPFANYELRTQEECCKLVEKLIEKLNQTNNNNISKRSKKAKKKIRKKESYYGHFGSCPLTKLKYFNYGISFLTDSLHTIYGGAYKQLLRLLFHSEYRNESWSLFKKIEKIDELLSLVQTPSTTQRRFRSIDMISKFKASEFRCLFHFGFTAIIQCMNDNKLKLLLLSLLTAINLASADYVTYESIESVKNLLNYFVQNFQDIFGNRHMSSNIHSLLHVHESLKYIGPLWFYSTFSFEGIDKDLIGTVHGTTNFAQQLVRQHVLYRDAIIQHKSDYYPMMLFKFNEELLNRKQSQIHYKDFIDSCYLPTSVSKELYDTSEHGIATQVQTFFNNELKFYNSLIISGVLVKTVTMTHGKLVGDCCISFYFDNNNIKYGLIVAIVKSSENRVRLFIEELVEKNPETSRFNFRINDKQYQVPNVYRLKRSKTFHLKHPKWILKKNAIICQPGGCVTVFEYPNLKDSS